MSQGHSQAYSIELCEHTYIPTRHMALDKIYVSFVPKSLQILFLVLQEENPKKEQAIDMYKYSSGIEKKCIEASRVGFHLLVKIPSVVTGSRTQLAHLPLLCYTSSVEAVCLFPGPGLCYQLNCV